MKEGILDYPRGSNIIASVLEKGSPGRLDTEEERCVVPGVEVGGMHFEGGGRTTSQGVGWP